MMKFFRPQFGVKSLLWVMLLMAAVITAYRSGFRAGFVQGENYRNSVGATFPKAYNVADLVSFDPATTSALRYAEELIHDLCLNVLPKTWQVEGGPANVAGYANNETIVVSHDQHGHDRIAEYLQQRRNMRRIANQN